MSVAFILTTINRPLAVGEFIDNCQAHGHKDVEFIVVGDLKSHPGTNAYLDSLAGTGFPITFLGPLEQERFLRRTPGLSAFLPYNSVQRRNIGFLVAYERGHEALISIDDDNFPIGGTDFVGRHRIVGDRRTATAVASSSGWYNSCGSLKTNPKRIFYHRGFPVNRRWLDNVDSFSERTARVVVNVGLWIGDPDVDTVTRLEEPFEVCEVADSERIVGIAKGTLFPYNSQNTAFHRDLLPTLFLVAMPDNGLIDHVADSLNFRYDDIWMSFFQKLIVDHIGDMITVGPPHVRQARNVHNYLHDLRRELIPMEITAKLADIFPKMRFSAGEYGEAYREMAENLKVYALYDKAFDRREKAILRQLVDGMLIWLDAVDVFSRG